MKANAILSHQIPWTPNTHLIFWLLFSLHFVIALYLKFVFGFGIESSIPPQILAGLWDSFWQTIPTASLMQHPVSSIWFLHSQPPIFNLLGALLMRLFFPNHLQALQYVYIVMGALSVGMSYVICLTLSKSVKLSFLVALYLAFHSSLFLYETYILYDILTGFEITTMVFLLCVYTLSSSRWRIGYLVAFLFTLTILILTRSLYHLVFLLPGLLIVCVLAGKQWKQILLVWLCFSLLPLGWYVKNYQQVDVFGTSSWLGLSLWKISSATYSSEELEDLAKLDIIDTVVAEVTAYNKPSKYIKYGFNKISENDELVRDDFNNINIPEISKVYQANAFRLIAHNPLRYIQAVVTSFYIFCSPASQFAHIEANSVKFGQYEFFYTDILQGYYPFRVANIPGSILVVLLPFSVILYTVLLVKNCGLSLRRWSMAIWQDAPMFFTALLIMYTVVVSCVLEFGENYRFKLGVEIPMWVFIATVHYRRYRRPPLILPVSDREIWS